MTVQYEPVIGLEIHVELSTNSKMFCGCKVAFGGEPNTLTCPVCLGLPGSLPVINEKAIQDIVKIGLALDCQVPEFTQFHRKNYFYPDMPKNYQISQYDSPVCVDGHLIIKNNGDERKINIMRVHMEEDTGKLIHIGESGRITGADYALADFNRAGTPLVEIVTQPDIKSADEARDFMRKLRNILLYLEVSDCNMEEGSLRCDANISIRPVESSALGTKVELKNMNSFKALHRGISYEIERQEKLLRSGGVIVQETRHFDAVKNVTTSLRSKEEAHDYRYFVEPDLVPMRLAGDYIQKIKVDLPELPEERKSRFVKDFELSSDEAETITISKAAGDYFEECNSYLNEPKNIYKWIMGELSYHLNSNNLPIENSPVRPKSLTELLNFVDDGTISGKMAKEVFEEMFESEKEAKEIVEEKGLVQITDENELENYVIEVINDNPSVVRDFIAGNDRVFGFLVGQVMKKTKGKANPKIVNDLLRSKMSR